MSGTTDEAGHRQPLLKRIKFALAAATLLGVFVGGPFVSGSHEAVAGAETRTLRLYQVNTKESLAVTYKVNGRYVPSAMAKINHLLRDWRRNQTTRMDPKTIDLMWELHADLGSRQPIHIVSGYRSAATNGFLRRIGRKVARKSQHIKGKAIDLYFPDVSTERIRNSALVRMVGGVGYYRRGGGPKGFVHIDSGNVRHWPRIAPSQLARIFRDYRGTVGKRRTVEDQVMIASVDVDKEKLAKAAADAAADGEEEIDEDIAEPPVKVGVTPPAPAPKPVLVVAKAAPVVPVPRDKPIDIYFAAAASMKITPAAAGPERKNFAKRSKPAADTIGALAAGEPIDLVVNSDAKGAYGDIAEEAKPAKAKPAIRTVSASASEGDLNWWPSSFGFDQETPPTPAAAAVEAELPSGLFPSANAAEPAPSTATGDGKADQQGINRDAKGDLLSDVPLKRQRVGLIRQ
jgi:uncharacterized protein YcbK (DUF882 family)